MNHSNSVLIAPHHILVIEQFTFSDAGKSCRLATLFALSWTVFMNVNHQVHLVLLQGLIDLRATLPTPPCPNGP